MRLELWVRSCDGGCLATRNSIGGVPARSPHRTSECRPKSFSRCFRLRASCRFRLAIFCTARPCACGLHQGAATVIRPIVHDRAAFNLQFFPCCQSRHSFRCPPHSNLLERQLTSRGAWRRFCFGNIHSLGRASRQDCGRVVPPPGNHAD